MTQQVVEWKRAFEKSTVIAEDDTILSLIMDRLGEKSANNYET